MSTIQEALQLITGKPVSRYVLLSAGNGFFNIIDFLSNKELPLHFNEVREDKDYNYIKEGFILLFEEDVIKYDSCLFIGMNKIYTPRQIREILKKQEFRLVK